MGQAFDLAEGTILFKGDLSQFDKDIEEGRKRLNSMNDALKQPRFAMAATEARRINMELEKAANHARRIFTGSHLTVSQQNRQEREESWLARRELKEQRQQEKEKAWAERKAKMEETRAQKAMVRAQNMQERDESWLARREKKEAEADRRKRKEAMDNFGRSTLIAGAAGVGVGAGAISAAGSASPLAADTLDKSFKLFTATVGQTFIPLIMDLSFTLQDSTKWWSKLDNSVKNNIASLTKGIAVTGAATLALGGLWKALSFISANPIIAGVGVAAGVLSMGLDSSGMQGMVNDTINNSGMNDQQKRMATLMANNTDIFQKTYKKAVMNSGLGDDKKLEMLEKIQGVEPSKRKLGSAGPASFVQASELIRSIQLSAAGSSELDAALKSEQHLSNIKVATQAMAQKMGLPVAP